MRDSTCRWCIVKKLIAKIFSGFFNFRGFAKLLNLHWSMQINILELPNHIFQLT